MEVKTTVLLFGPLAEVAGTGKVELNGCADTKAAEQSILKQYPKLAGYKYALALNKVLIREATVLTEGATLAFLPPFSGG